MGPLDVLPADTHLFGLTAAVTVALQASFFVLAYACHTDKVTDFAGSTNFILNVLLALFVGVSSVADIAPRAILATSLVVVCRLELAAYLLYRVLRRGKDARFDEVRGSFIGFAVFWLFQAVWAFGVSLPVVFVNADPARTSPELGAADWAGLGMWVVGFLVQVVSDLQKDAFRADTANKAKWCDAGLWKYSRHPNFFGEILLWWGIFVVCTPQFAASADAAAAGVLGAASWGWVTVLSPILTMVILLLGSGMPTAEGVNQRRFLRTPEQKAAFLAYRARTSPLIPLPPALYGALPLLLKRALLFEWPLYETDWSWTPEAEAAEKAKGGAAASAAFVDYGSTGKGEAVATSSPLPAAGADPVVGV